MELVNGLFPVNKATILMLSGDLSNFRRLVSLKDDKGKEQELRSVALGLYQQLGLVWPEIIKDKE
jgi:thymidylate synthase ThyX